MSGKRLLASMLMVTFSASATASIQSEMQTWFNEMGAYGNVTGAQVVQGQTTTVYTGGSMYMRTPIRNYQLASIAPPSIRAGCGGIDLFADRSRSSTPSSSPRCCATSPTTRSATPS